jgi:hypothetical protein
MGYFIAVGVLMLAGFLLMLCNYVERPHNDCGQQSAYNAGQRPEFHPDWPPENARFMHKFRRWWEL